MKLLEGKVALITGAARGIGKAVALKFAAEGANIAFTDLVIDEVGQKTKKELEDLDREVEERIKAYDQMIALWGEFDTSLIHVDDVRMSIKKIAGVRVPVLDEVVYTTKEFSLFSSPKWFADGFEQLKAIADVGIRQEFVRRKVELLEYARKKTTQKVNLFEKVQIPGYQDAIRKIKRFMEDEENLSKSSQMIVKGKREREAREAEERRAQQ